MTSLIPFRQFALACGISAATIGSLTAATSAGEKLLHTFQGGSDGYGSQARLMMDNAGNLYGTTTGGGGVKHCHRYGCGTVFRIAPDGTETVLHAFTGGCDGAYPDSGLVADSAGNMYGVTSSAGGIACENDFGRGTIYKITPDGAETVLHTFTGDYQFPSGALLIDHQGNLIGSLFDSGNGYIFKLSSEGEFSKVYEFKGGNDGRGPLGNLIQDKAGNIFGTTYGGGSAGCGTVFKLAPDGSETVLYAFQNGADGSAPNGGVVSDKAGNLYGTCSEADGHASLVFKVAPDGTETVLHAFSFKSTDGWQLFDSVIIDKHGMLYGAAYRGGDLSCGRGYGCGTIFKLAPDGEATVLLAFDKRHRGRDPYGSVLHGKDGNLYGTTLDGGDYKGGVVFKLTN